MDFCKQDVLILLAGLAVWILAWIFYLRYEELETHIKDGGKISEISIKVTRIEDKLSWIQFTNQ